MFYDPLLAAGLGTGFTFAATAVGAAAVLAVKQKSPAAMNRAFLGFAAGVMIAASVWSLLLPAQEAARQQGQPEWLPTALGVLAGGIFLMLADRITPHLQRWGKLGSRRTALLVLAVTMHNLPEGMAVGLAFAAAAADGSHTAFAGAAALAVGMALQNLPEGAAISLPLYQEGMGRTRAFVYGAASGAVEPLGGLVGVLLAVWMRPLMPALLSFAAGAMLYVVVQELVPDSCGSGKEPGTVGALLGFVLMMLLDVALG